MDELIMRLGIGVGPDLVSMFSFFAVAAVYFLAPVVGYELERRGNILTSMYLLAACNGLSLFAMLVQSHLLNWGGMGMGREITSSLGLLATGFLKIVLFLFAQLLFIMGLQALQLRRPDRERFERDRPDRERYRGESMQ